VIASFFPLISNEKVVRRIETEEFWDDFAETYYEIQEESRLPIAEDAAAFLAKAGIFPTQTFADAAGGTGRYLKNFAPQTGQYDLIDFSDQMLKFAKIEAEKHALENVHFIQKNMADFFADDQKYDVVFSAMNPALTEENQLLQLMRKSKKWVVVLRMIENHDDLFSRADQLLGIAETDPNDDSSLMDTFERFLTAQNLGSHKKDFTYQYQEEITREMVEEYYEEQQNHPLFQSLLERLFKGKTTICSTTTITYRLLYWPAGDKEK
jgi:ubiquinone/menaquinone biosynthesis C-methylase UbiE